MKGKPGLLESVGGGKPVKVGSEAGEGGVGARPCKVSAHIQPLENTPRHHLINPEIRLTIVSVQRMYALK